MRTLVIYIFFLLLLCKAFAQTPLSSKVEMVNGKPTITLNGVPQNPMFYALTDIPGGRWSWEELPKHTMQTFCVRGFRLIQVDIAFDNVWQPDGSLNMDTVRMQLKGVLNICPDAAIMIRFHVNAPKWWQRQHPEEKTLYADTDPKPDYAWGLNRMIEDDEVTVDRFSLASEKWKNESTEKLREFLKKLVALPESNALMGIQVASGVYGEWHYWGFINNEPDMSEPMLTYFRGWLKMKYQTTTALRTAWHNTTVTLENATLPDLKERGTTQAGIFRDPLKERKIIDYYEAQHTVVAEDILHFCRIVKENWPRPIITGAFYGYYYAIFGREAAGGHLELTKVLESPYIDFLCGPNTYYPENKDTGEPYRSRSLINSVALHGKLWLDEMDQQPPLLHFADTAYMTSVKQSIANTRRNVLFTYAKGMGLWFYDFGPSGFNGGKRLNDHGSWGWWDDPYQMKDIAQLKTVLDKNFLKPAQNDADVLLVHDTKSFYYTGSSKDKSYMGHWATNWIPPAVFKSGVVHDVIHMDDLDKVNINQYRAILFINTWTMTDKEKLLITKKIAGGNRHLIFVYAPGYSNEKEVNKKFITAVTGMSVQQVKSSKITTVQLSQSAGGFSYNVSNRVVDPLFVVNDRNAITLGTLKDTTAVAVATKKFPNYTSWFMSIPNAKADFWRYVFKQAGAHIYDEQADIFYSGNGILSIHTLKGGERKIVLKNGKMINITLKSNSTLLLDSTTGEVLMN
jgi:hypothetical protein